MQLVSLKQISGIGGNNGQAGEPFLVSNETLAAAAGLVQRNTYYDKGDLLYDPQLIRHDRRLECVTAGTTGDKSPNLAAIKLGDKITDGTAEWVVTTLKTDSSFFEIDEDGNLMPTENPVYSSGFEIDNDGGIMPSV